MRCLIVLLATTLVYGYKDGCVNQYGSLMTGAIYSVDEELNSMLADLEHLVVDRAIEQESDIARSNFQVLSEAGFTSIAYPLFYSTTVYGKEPTIGLAAELIGDIFVDFAYTYEYLVGLEDPADCPSYPPTFDTCVQHFHYSNNSQSGDYYVALDKFTACLQDNFRCYKSKNIERQIQLYRSAAMRQIRLREQLDKSGHLCKSSYTNYPV